MSHDAAKRLRDSYELAYFIYTDKEVAMRIARVALNKLDVAANAQFKRYYYNPTGRAKGGAAVSHRSKVIYREPQLLQRLVYNESELLEMEQERKGETTDLRRSDMVVRFVKFLVKTTMKRNSFYVSLGVTRLLYAYTTPEAMELYTLVVQDPDRVPDDHYYRSRKKKLMTEIRNRFGDLLRLVRGSRGETRFETMDDPGAMTSLVGTCLERFTPWDTQCVLQDKVDRFGSEVKGLHYDGDDPDGEHAVEINRLHAVLHPECFQHLAASVEMKKPEASLAVPVFQMAETIKDTPDDRDNPPDMHEGDQNEADTWLSGQKEGRRRSKVGGLLRILADGREVACLDVSAASKVTAVLPEDCEMVEIVDPNHVLLACCLVDEDMLSGGIWESKVMVEGGQELTFRIDMPEDVDLETLLTFEMQVAYRETNPLRMAQLAWIRGRKRLAPLWQPKALPVWGVAFATLLLMILTPQKPMPTNTSFTSEVRGLQVQSKGLPLVFIQKIYVDSLGETVSRVALRDALMAAIEAGGRFSLASERSEADAVFKNLDPFLDADGKLVLSLINAEGETLWQATYMPEENGPAPSSLSVEIVKALENDVRRDEQKRGAQPRD